MSNFIPLKTRNRITGLLNNRWAFACFSMMLIQQVIESSATYWLVAFTQSITSGATYFPYLAFYLASLLIPYIPGCVGQIFKTSWKQDSHRTFVNSFVRSNKDNIGEWSNKGVKEEKLSILTSEGPNTLNTFIDYIWDLVTYALSVLFNILALSIVVEPLFAVSYVASVSCVILVMKLRRRTQRQLTKKALIARVDLCQSLLAAWDNVLLGNEYNFKLWSERTLQRLKRCLQRNVDLERFDQLLAISASLITSIPCLCVVGYFTYKYQNDPAKLTAFAVILPLLFMILSYTYQTLSLGFRWGMHRSKLHTIYKAIQPVTSNPTMMERKIKWPKIVTNFASTAPTEKISLPGPLEAIISHMDLVSQTQNKGRLTLRGENGSGKSTALMLIKNTLGDRAFFLPTHNQLSFASETNKYSTGESLRNRLLEILDKVEADVLLLDEWDANLDPDNRDKLSELIDEISRRKCVVEVRHR